MQRSSLEGLGLNKKEARVYLACLEMGHGSAHTIARHAGFPRSTAADILKMLVKKGLVLSYLKKSRKRFVVADPAVLQEKLDQQQKVLQGLMPELSALYGGKTQKPQVRFYEGKDGLNAVFREILREAKDLIAVSSIEDTANELGDYLPAFSKERAKRGIPVRIISYDSQAARERQILGPYELRQVKLCETKIQFHSLSLCWDHKLALVTLGDGAMIVVIESRDISQTFRAMFEWLWERA